MIKRILIIKHGALGDIIKCLPAIHSIQSHFKDAEISLLTDPKNLDIHQLFFRYDKIFEDIRCKKILNIFKILTKIKVENFDLIIDLQNSKRTNRYFYILKYLLFAAPKWSGTARGCDFYLPFNIKKKLHVIDRFKQQLKILNIPWLNFNFEQTPIESTFDESLLPKKFILMIPGCSPVSPEKKWPIKNFIDLSNQFKTNNIDTVFIGGPSELNLNQILTDRCAHALNLINKLEFKDILKVACHSQAIIGNDTGPLYLTALSNKPHCVLWSNHSDSNLHKPCGDHIHIIQHHNINDITSQQVLTQVKPYLS